LDADVTFDCLSMHFRAKHFVAEATAPASVGKITKPVLFNPFARVSTNVGMTLTYDPAINMIGNQKQ